MNMIRFAAALCTVVFAFPPAVIAAAAPTYYQSAYVKASNTGLYDTFGRSVALSGDTMVIGAPGEASSATGVNGNQANNSASGAGAVYVLVFNGTNWVQQAYLKA